MLRCKVEYDVKPLQRDKEEAQWQAAAPQREAEKRRQEEITKKYRDSLHYEERIVAFIDILGWHEAIEQSINDGKSTQNQY